MTSDRRTTETERIPSPPQTDYEALDAAGGSAPSTLKPGTNVERNGDDFILDATLVGELLDVQPSEVAALMRNKRITSVCESGVDADRGTFRLNLFYLGRHARVRVDAAGHILHHSIIDFGDLTLPRRRRSSDDRSAESDPMG